MLPGGWLRTGDLGWQDSSGCLWLLGRAKDMVKSGGENVYASEVEAVLLQHPGVAAAAVVGVPDARLGEKVAVLLVLQEGWAWQQGQGQQQQGQDRVWQQRQQQGPQDTSSCALPAGSISAADLAEHCRAAGLSGYKVPRAVAVAPGLPLNSSGKVVRSMARDMVMLQLGMAPVRSRL
jgi:acyl-activating enzyme 14